jgi:prepilin peptidase CpaA
MLAAALSDLRHYRIPNWMSGAVALLFLLAVISTGMPLKLALWHGLAGVVVLFVGFALFAVRIVGGGDAKLLAAAALWIGWTKLFYFIFYTALAGGVLAICMVAWEVVRLHIDITSSNSQSSLLKRLTSLKPDLPYGVAIAAGACFALPQTWWAASAVLINR